MGRLRVVEAVAARPWRLYLAPAAALLVATVAIWLLRGQLHTAGSHAPAAAAHAHVETRPAHRRSYVVRPGDTIEAISARTGVPQSRILSLNPKVSPTALFIGERLRLP
jgi:hypothetical protein